METTSESKPLSSEPAVATTPVVTEEKPKKKERKPMTDEEKKVFVQRMQEAKAKKRSIKQEPLTIEEQPIEDQVPVVKKAKKVKQVKQNPITREEEQEKSSSEEEEEEERAQAMHAEEKMDLVMKSSAPRGEVSRTRKSSRRVTPTPVEQDQDDQFRARIFG